MGGFFRTIIGETRLFMPDVALMPEIGFEIDSMERQTYHLFPDVDAFIQAQLHRVSEHRYRIEVISLNRDGNLDTLRSFIDEQDVENTRLHTGLVEKYDSVSAVGENLGTFGNEELLMLKLGLRYTIRNQYQTALMLLKDVLNSYPGSDAAIEARELITRIQVLQKTRRGLFKPGSWLDRSGRTELLIFSGYYGLWLGIATPPALDARSPQSSALGLLLGAPVSFMLTRHWTRSAEMSTGRSTFIILGGYWGTWQGIGWLAVGNQNAQTVVGIGELLGLAGIGLGSMLTRDWTPSEGHAVLTSAGLEWGAWLGLVSGMLWKDKDKAILRDMLIGSNLAILGNAVFTREIRMSKTRMRLLNLSGVAGAVCGFGIDLMLEINDTRPVFLIAGTSSILGLVVGIHWTRNFDDPGPLSRNSPFYQVTVNPWFSFGYSPSDGTNHHQPIPLAGLQIRF